MALPEPARPESLAEHESVIERGLQTFVDVGNSLIAIKAGKLYKEAGYSTFDEYCRGRWQIGRHRGYQLMTAAATHESLTQALPEMSTNVNIPPPEREAQVRPLAPLPDEQKAEAWTAAVESAGGDQPTAAHVEAAVAHVSHNGGNNEWYTPTEYIALASTVMGDIDLDPASSAEANEVVDATKYYTADDNGLELHWFGRVWMNPPYAQPLIGQFCNRMVESFTAGDVEQACVLVNNATETVWFQTLVEPATAVCFPRGRVKFWTPGKIAAPLQGQALVYLGPNAEAFIVHASALGWVARR